MLRRSQDRVKTLVREAPSAEPRNPQLQ